MVGNCKEAWGLIRDKMVMVRVISIITLFAFAAAQAQPALAIRQVAVRETAEAAALGRELGTQATGALTAQESAERLLRWAELALKAERGTMNEGRETMDEIQRLGLDPPVWGENLTSDVVCEIVRIVVFARALRALAKTDKEVVIHIARALAELALSEEGRREITLTDGSTATIAQACRMVAEGLRDAEHPEVLEEYCRVIEECERLCIAVRSGVAHALTDSLEDYICMSAVRINILRRFCNDEAIAGKLSGMGDELTTAIDIFLRMCKTAKEKQGIDILTEADTLLKGYQDILRILAERRDAFAPLISEINKETVREFSDYGPEIMDYLVRAEAVVKSQIGFMEGDANIATVDFGHIISEAVEEAMKKLNLRKRPIIQIDSAAPSVNGDTIMLRRIVSEFFYNAYVHSHPKKRREINIMVSVRGEEIILSISDNGKGMSEDSFREGRLPVRPVIFDLNFTTRKGGTGLGLCEAWWVVHDHGGAISVESQEGRGTAFTIRLPAAAAPLTGLPVATFEPQQPDPADAMLKKQI